MMIFIKKMMIVITYKRLVMAEDTFSARLRGLRERNNWNARVMSEKTGIPKQTLESYMSLKAGPLPGFDAMKKLALGLEVSLDWLVFGAQPVGDDVARIVRLSAMSGALPCFELLLNKLQQGEAVLSSDGTLLGLTPQEWAADIGWRAGEKAKAISERGTSRATLEAGERAMDSELEGILKDRFRSATEPATGN